MPPVAVSHPGPPQPSRILRAQVPASCELGPAIVFEFDATAQQLDHFLAENRAQLDVGARLEILQQIADAIRDAHDKDVVHRALCPQPIYVTRNKGGEPRIQIYNWQTGARLPDGSFSGLTNLTASIHAAQLVEEPARAYIAPESLTPSEEPSEAMDVFSLGALAYFLIGDQPPAADATELLEKLKASASRSLDLRSADSASLDLRGIRDGVSDRIAKLDRGGNRAAPSRASRVAARCRRDRSSMPCSAMRGSISSGNRSRPTSRGPTNPPAPTRFPRRIRSAPASRLSSP